MQEAFGSIPRIKGNPWVIESQKRGDHLKTLDAIWLRLRKRAKLGDVRIRDARHSYASRALGERLSMIGVLLGHAKVTTTARYVHLAQHSVRESAVRASDSIAADILRDYRPAAS